MHTILEVFNTSTGDLTWLNFIFCFEFLTLKNLILQCHFVKELFGFIFELQMFLPLKILNVYFEDKLGFVT